MKAIELRNVTFSYPGSKETVFKDFNLSLNKNGFFFILGANGSGKSTFVKLILGALQPQNGEVLFNDQQISSRKERAKRIGYVPQDLSLDPEMSVIDLIQFIGTLQGRSSNQLKEGIQLATKALELDEFLPKRIKQLSGGQKQRVNIALSLLHDPDIILLDEPFTGLDYYTNVKVLSALSALNKMIICITHDLDLAEQYATEVLLLKNGKLLEQDQPDQLIQKHPFELTEFDLNISVMEEIKGKTDWPSEMGVMIQQNRVVLSYPIKEAMTTFMENFRVRYKNDIRKETVSGRTLKSSVVGIHDLSIHKNEEEVEAAAKERSKKGNGPGSGTGGGGGGGKGRNRS